MAKKNEATPKNFEEALAELEKILSEIEAGEVGLEETLVKYERGNFLIKHCRGILAVAEKEIERISKTADVQGEAVAADESGSGETDSH
ncbi:MAG TPA: exodeoxyribonuclease VII small subunit [Tepidisphaeraceae bacterium]|nr:exodeoxyribonuclease VII small subunit [Tepidisphaeraceae bacterium]